METLVSQPQEFAAMLKRTQTAFPFGLSGLCFAPFLPPKHSPTVFQPAYTNATLPYQPPQHYEERHSPTFDSSSSLA